MPYMRIVALLAMLSAWAGAPAANAQETTSIAPIDIVIVLDDSGSMVECYGLEDQPSHGPPCKAGETAPNDPDNLRYSAARLLAQLADDDDRIAVIRFDSEVEPVTSYDLQPLGPPDQRGGLIENIRPPSNYEQRGYTRIDKGIEKAVAILAGRADKGRPGYIIFLTDGTPTNPGPNPAERAQARALQRRDVQRSAALARRENIQVMSIALCAPANSAEKDCADFLKQNLGDTRRASSARDLLRVYSEIFAQIKPNLQIVSPVAAGRLTFETQPDYGVYEINAITTRAGFGALSNNGGAYQTATALSDNNLALNVARSGGLPSGEWSLDESGGNGFVVARTASYPDVAHPPPSIDGSSWAARYVPAGKPTLIIGQAVGPGNLEIYLNGDRALQPFSTDGSARWIVLPNDQDRFSLQLGNNSRPLQIIRDFQVRPMDGLPTATAHIPKCAAEVPCELAIDLAAGIDISDLRGQVYIAEVGDGEKPVYQHAMACAERRCSDSGFTPDNGRIYQVRFAVNALASTTNEQGEQETLRFGDWDETALTMRPAVRLLGLPSLLNPQTQPEGGWPVNVLAGIDQDLGRLSGFVELRNMADGARVNDLTVEFGVDVRNRGSAQTTLRLAGAADLGPGHYAGQVVFRTSIQPADGTVELPAPAPIDFKIENPRADIAQSNATFPDESFDPSPNFRVDQSTSLSVDYPVSPFPIAATVVESSCAGMQAAIDPPQDPTARKQALTLRLRSAGPLQPQVCRGTLQLAGPGAEYKVAPVNTIAWEVRIRSIEWDIIGAISDDRLVSDLRLPPFGNADERGGGILRIRYNGAPDFKVRLIELSGSDDDGETALDAGRLDFISQPPRLVEAGVYDVPVELRARQDLPADWRGIASRTYSGEMLIGIEGLPDAQAYRQAFSFEQPGLWKRYSTLIMCLGALAFGIWIIRRRMNNPPPKPIVEPAGPARRPRPIADKQGLATPGGPAGSARTGRPAGGAASIPGPPGPRPPGGPARGPSANPAPPGAPRPPGSGPPGRGAPGGPRPGGPAKRS
ncbi:MAG TPA: VWA domain-containing protein [Herpetosiphonaceae bacterium]|nr:VWA domain-containing protein [Herpetosiphonaceae bacterium]